jgi:hypothetical protein
MVNIILVTIVSFQMLNTECSLRLTIHKFLFSCNTLLVVKFCVSVAFQHNIYQIVDGVRFSGKYFKSAHNYRLAGPISDDGDY